MRLIWGGGSQCSATIDASLQLFAKSLRPAGLLPKSLVFALPVAVTATDSAIRRFFVPRHVPDAATGSTHSRQRSYVGQDDLGKQVHQSNTSASRGSCVSDPLG